MKATINAVNNYDAYGKASKPEFNKAYAVVCENRLVIKATIAQPGNSRVYCAIHVGNSARWFCGGGHADGYGYHKPSAALENAINSVGITLDESISGRGNSAMIEALAAVAVAMGYDEPNVIEI